MESTGYYLNKWKERKEPSKEEMEEIAKLEIKIEEKKLPEQSKKFFLESESLLKQPFSFYSFGVKINEE